MSLNIKTRGNTLLWMQGGKLITSGTPTPPANSVTLTIPSGSFVEGDTINASGRVVPANDSIRLVWDQQGTTTPPLTAVGVIAVSVGNNYANSVTAPSPGASNWYLWAIDDATSQTAKVGPITIASKSIPVAVSVNAPTGVIHPNDVVQLTGKVTPAGSYQYLISQSTTAPTTGWLSGTTNLDGTFAANVTPTAIGVWYGYAREPVSGTTQRSSGFTVIAQTTSAVVIPFSVRNALDTPSTDTWHLGGGGFGPADVPAGWYPKVCLSDGVTEVAEYQWNPETFSRRKDGDLRFATLRMKIAGTLSAYGTTGDTANFKIVPTPGSGPSGAAITVNDVINRSNFEIRLFGPDYTADLANSNDYFYVGSNEIFSSRPRDTAGIGLNPVGWYRVEYAGPLEICIMFKGLIRRKSDGAFHKWKKAEGYIHALKTGEFEFSGRDLQGNLYGAHASGTVGADVFGQPNVPAGNPAQPRHAGFVEVWETKNNRYVGGWGGLREERQFTIPASAFDVTTNKLNLSSVTSVWPSPTTYPVVIPTQGGPFPTSTGVTFAPADGSSTLPSNILPNRVYWIAWSVNGSCWLCQERCDTVAIDTSGSGPDRAQATWAPNLTVYDKNSAGAVITNIVTVNYNNVLLARRGLPGATPVKTGSSLTINQLNTQVNPPNVADGGAGLNWRQVTVPFGTAGTGNIRIIPVCATFSNTAVELRDSYGRRFWMDPANKPRPWTLHMPDFDYAVKKSFVVPPYWKSTTNPVPSSRTFRYVPNQRFTMCGRQSVASWDVARNPGESEDDFRLGLWAGWASLRLQQPGDRNTCINSATWAANFSLWTFWAEDERTGYPVLCNQGPGGSNNSYPLMPPNTLNPGIWWTNQPSTCLGTPKPISVGYIGTTEYRHNSGFTYFYQQLANQSHMPNPAAPEYFFCGDPSWLSYNINHTIPSLTHFTPSERNRTIAGKFYNGLIACRFEQARGIGWMLGKWNFLACYCPDAHPLRPYIDDVQDTAEAYYGGGVTNDMAPEWLRWGQCSGAQPDSVWSMSHMHEGIGMMAFSNQKADGSNYRPGWLWYINNVMVGAAKIYDACTYYFGIYWISYQATNGNLTTTFTDAVSLLKDPNNNTMARGNTQGSGIYRLGQLGDGSFFCPGPTQTAPETVLNANWPGVGFLNGGSGSGGITAPFQASFPWIDPTCVTTQNAGPMAIAASVHGSDPIFLRVWDAFAARANALVPGAPRFVFPTAARPSDGCFMYGYKPISR